MAVFEAGQGHDICHVGDPGAGEAFAVDGSLFGPGFYDGVQFSGKTLHFVVGRSADDG